MWIRRSLAGTELDSVDKTVVVFVDRSRLHEGGDWHMAGRRGHDSSGGGTLGPLGIDHLPKDLRLDRSLHDLVDRQALLHPHQLLGWLSDHRGVDGLHRGTSVGDYAQFVDSV